MYPPTGRFDRVASEDYFYEKYKIFKDQVVSVPIWAVYYDEHIFPEPQKFNPERFIMRESDSFIGFEQAHAIA